jgi:hypothetical protein
MKILIWLGISSLSGFLYTLSGKGGFKDAKAIRRFGCPLLIYGYLWLIRPSLGLHGAIFGVFAYVLTALALSTYHDYLSPDGTSENWLCWLMTGLCYGLAAFPLFWAGIHWYMIGIRAVVLAILTMVWSEKIGWDRLEEFGRGALLIITLPLLLI